MKRFFVYDDDKYPIDEDPTLEELNSTLIKLESNEYVCRDIPCPYCKHTKTDHCSICHGRKLIQERVS